MSSPPEFTDPELEAIEAIVDLFGYDRWAETNVDHKIVGSILSKIDGYLNGTD